MKKRLYERKIVLIACIGLVVAIVPWFIFQPFNSMGLFEDALKLRDASGKYGEECKVYVKDSWFDSKNPSQDLRDIQSLVNELSVNITSHIQKKENKVYRYINNSSPFGATDGQGASSLIFETIYDNGSQYARYDTTGPWIGFSEKLLSDMGDYIQSLFQDQFYDSINDIKSESIHLKEVQVDGSKKRLYVYRGQQTEKSLSNSQQLFEYPVRTYDISDQYGDVIVDPETKLIVKTVLYTLFDYKDSNDESTHLHIPVYQECTPVAEKDLKVEVPSNSIKVDEEQARQYLLFKVLPK